MEAAARQKKEEEARARKDAAEKKKVEEARKLAEAAALSAGSIKENIKNYKEAIAKADSEGRKGDSYDFSQILKKLEKEQKVIDQ
jgi:proline dehydrogenase